MPRLDVFLPHLKTGGIEVGLVRLAPALLDREISLRFVLQQGTGELRARLPEGVQTIALDARNMPAAARSYAAVLRGAPCDIVYSATNATNVAQLLAGRLLGRAAPLAIVGEHIPLDRFLQTRKRPGLRRWIMRRTYPGATAVVAPVPDILDEHRVLLGRKCPPTTVLPNPVIDAVTALPPLAQTARRFVAIGRLSPEKGFDLALRVMAAYRAHDPQAHLMIYGEGSDRPRLEALLQELDLAGTVTLAGRTDDVPTALAAADLFLCTSHVEGFGNAIVEAQAAGVPVASVDCPFGPRLLLREGRAGLLLRDRDAAGIAKALHHFAGDTAGRFTAQQAGQAVAADYTLTRSADAHAALFHELAGGR